MQSLLCLYGSSYPPPFFEIYNPASCSSPFIFSCLFHNVIFNHRYLNFFAQNHVFSLTLWLFLVLLVSLFSSLSHSNFNVTSSIFKPNFIFSVPYCPRFLSCPFSNFCLVPILLLFLSLFCFFGLSLF